MAYSKNVRLFSFGIPQELYTKLSDFSHENNVSMTKIIQDSLKLYLESDYFYNRHEVLITIRELRNVLTNLFKEVKRK